jgi:hypothetical protein
MTAFRQIRKLPDRDAGEGSGINLPPTANSPFTSGKAASYAVDGMSQKRKK